MWPWFGWNPWYRMPYSSPYGGYGTPYGYPYGGYGYGYPGAMPKEQEIAMLEDQKRWLTSELDGVKKRLEELRK